jgi:hypothetical protein
MSRPETGGGRLWVVIAAMGVLGIVWLATHVRLPESPRTDGQPIAHPSVGLVDPVVIQGTMLRDPTPLFLPTEFNSSRKDYRPREPGGGFSGYPAELTFSESELTLHLPPAVAVPAEPADALAGDPPGAPFLGFGRTDMLVETLAPRGAYVEIVDSGSGRSVFSRPLPDARPPSSPPWKPMEFMAAVDSAGLVGPLVLTVHSNVAGVDAYFARFLAEDLRVGQRLEPGFYRICVGP